MIEKLKNPQVAAPLFEGWQETMIWSCLQGVMGEVYGNHAEKPTAVKAVLADFSFVAGEPDEELVRYQPSAYTLLVPQNEAWAALIERCLKERARKVERFAILKEPGVFDRKRLAEYTQRTDIELRPIDQALYERCKAETWSRDFVWNYPTWEEFERLGLGVAALKNGQLVAGASSYTSYRGGIEVEIDTKAEFRRQGLATACGAALILRCLERGWYPSWDAANLWSAALAEKLGYHRGESYITYEVEAEEPHV